ACSNIVVPNHEQPNTTIELSNKSNAENTRENGRTIHKTVRRTRQIRRRTPKSLVVFTRWNLRAGRNSRVIEAWKRALVLAPHTDDGELGCGGAMARLVEDGCGVRYVAFSIATRSLPPGFEPDTLAREVREATAELGIE